MDDATLTMLAERLDDSFGLVEERSRCRDLVPISIADDRPALHVEDYSAIPSITMDVGVEHYTSRALHRAGGDDVVAATGPALPEYEQYLRESLGLTPPACVSVPAVHPRSAVFAALLQTPDVLRRIASEWAPGEPVVIHPFLSLPAAWEVARALARLRTTPVQVLGPLPGLATALNDKGLFLEVAEDALGSDAVVEYVRASSVAEAATHARRFLQSHQRAVVKLSAGSAGVAAFHIDRATAADDLERALDSWLQQFMRSGWTPALVVGPWYEDVIGSPSAQLWVPPPNDGPPVVDGLMDQLFAPGGQGIYDGCRPTTLPTAVTKQLHAVAMTLGRLFQQLGYVGRCSFDFILRGADVMHALPQLIECNARWGAASTPLAFLNRVFGAGHERPYVVRILSGFQRLRGIPFARFAEVLHDVLYDRAADRGWCIPLNVGTLEPFGRLTVVTLGDSVTKALERQDELRRLLVKRI
ncbi:MAG: hypothetical protein HYZ09_01620 [Candidatus Kerfeldbacteria bacterium]|nr:hypothetical protein [Candidatus Kerfeldbacteria bacterium]